MVALILAPRGPTESPMRSFRRLLPALLVLSGCSSGSELDGGEDAGTDVPADAPLRDVPRDTSWDGGPAPEWRVELVPGPAFGATCADWVEAAHPHPTPDLAPAGAPRVLWEWDPADDPLVQALPRFLGHTTTGLAISPTGTVWAYAPDGSAVVGIGRDGRARWLVELAGGDPEVNGVLGRPPAVAPDGTGFVAYRSPRTLARIDDDGRTLSSFALGVGLLEAPSIASVAIGPSGRVYVRDAWLPSGLPPQSHLVALCHGQDLIWELRILRRELGGDWEHAGPTGVRVLEDGRLIASVAYTGDLWLIDEDGSAALAGADPSVVLGNVSTMRDAVSDRIILQDDVAPDVVWARAASLASGRTWEDHSGANSFYWFDGLSRIWRARTDATGGAFALSILGTGSEATDLGPAGFCRRAFPVFVSDGGVLCTDGVPGEAAVARLGASGEDLWRLVLGEPGAGLLEIAHDIDGRIYGVLTGPASTDAYGPYGRIVAIQSDVTPPRGAFCIGYAGDGFACNRHRNDWLHDYGAP